MMGACRSHLSCVRQRLSAAISALVFFLTFFGLSAGAGQTNRGLLPNQDYVNNAESKFNGPDGNQCRPWTRGILQRMHVVAREHRYCGKEFKRKLEQGPVDHEVDFKCKVYENGRVAAGPETLRQLAGFSERQIRKGTGVCRDAVRLIRHGKGVKRSTYEKVIDFLRENASSAAH
jgi:hypothetical protein